MSVEKLNESDDLRACYITDIWNSPRHFPDLNFPIVVFPGDGETEYRLSIADAEAFQESLNKAISEAGYDQKVLNGIIEVISQYEKAGVELTVDRISLDTSFPSFLNFEWYVRRLVANNEISIEYDYTDFNKSKLRLKW